MKKSKSAILLAGLIGGFVGNGVLGVLFTLPVIKNLLYDPTIQSRLFIDITPSRNMPVSVTGLVILSISHGWLFSVFQPSIPGNSWWKKGIFWGLTIWIMYWVFQEWFIYHTLLAEPIILNILELTLLLVGSLVEGVIIAYILARK
ncbi:MAG: hypothetical protein HZB62_04035 [Nitrospirae bacterium]|nr:hypothetical protein [Nitrospirota bacterium]